MQVPANAATLKNILRYADGKMARRERKEFELSMMTDEELEATKKNAALRRDIFWWAAGAAFGLAAPYALSVLVRLL